MKHLYLIRHAESKAQTGEVPNDPDTELSLRGVRQAKALGRALRRLKVDVAIISPLKRAWQTYMYARFRFPKVEFDSRIIEWGSGYESILPVETPDFGEPDIQDAWLKDGFDRCEDLLESILKREEKRIVLFGHAGIFNAFFFCFVKMRGDCSLHIENTSVSILEVDDRDRRIVRALDHYPSKNAIKRPRY
jgi:broad specificity phosphatase PhoE